MVILLTSGHEVVLHRAQQSSVNLGASEPFDSRSVPVGEAELNGKYRRLRSELDAAYAGPEWDAGRINRIADEIVEVELALASVQSGASTLSPSHSFGE